MQIDQITTVVNLPHMVSLTLTYVLGAQFILVTNFFGEVIKQINHQFQITNFSVSSHQNVLFNLVVIANLKCSLQLHYTAHNITFWLWKQKN